MQCDRTPKQIAWNGRLFLRICVCGSISIIIINIWGGLLFDTVRGTFLMSLIIYSVYRMDHNRAFVHRIEVHFIRFFKKVNFRFFGGISRNIIYSLLPIISRNDKCLSFISRFNGIDLSSCALASLIFLSNVSSLHSKCYYIHHYISFCKSNNIVIVAVTSPYFQQLWHKNPN